MPLVLDFPVSFFLNEVQMTPTCAERALLSDTARILPPAGEVAAPAHQREDG